MTSLTGHVVTSRARLVDRPTASTSSGGRLRLLDSVTVGGLWSVSGHPRRCLDLFCRHPQQRQRLSNSASQPVNRTSDNVGEATDCSREQRLGGKSGRLRRSIASRGTQRHATQHSAAAANQPTSDATMTAARLPPSKLPQCWFHFHGKSRTT